MQRGWEASSRRVGCAGERSGDAMGWRGFRSQEEAPRGGGGGRASPVEKGAKAGAGRAGAWWQELQALWLRVTPWKRCTLVSKRKGRRGTCRAPGDMGDPEPGRGAGRADLTSPLKSLRCLPGPWLKLRAVTRGRTGGAGGAQRPPTVVG